MRKISSCLQLIALWLLLTLACQVSNVQKLMVPVTGGEGSVDPVQPQASPLPLQPTALPSPQIDPAQSLPPQFANVALHVVERLPEPSAQGVSPLSPVAVHFDRPVVGSGRAPFKVTPEIQGDGGWVNPYTFVFYPMQPLAGRSAFTVTLDSGLSGVDGSRLAQDELLEWTFTTSKPMVDEVVPQPQTIIPPNSVFEISFSHPMDIQSVAENFQLMNRDEGMPVAGKIAWDRLLTRLTFVPDEFLTRGANYSLVIAAQTRTLAGEPLGEDVIAAYVVCPALSVQSVDIDPSVGLALSNGVGSFVIRFNNPLAEQDFASLIRFDPPAEGASFDLREEGYALQVSADLRTNAQYILSVSSSLQDIWHQPLAAELPATFSFFTAASVPSLTVPRLENTSPLLFVLPSQPVLPVMAQSLQAIEVASLPLRLRDFVLLAKSADQLLDYNPVIADALRQPLQLSADRPQMVDVRLSPAYIRLPSGLYYYRLLGIPADGISKAHPVPFLLVSSRIHLTIKRSSEGVLIWAVNLENNKPVAKGELVIYDSDFVQVASCQTDREGLCQTVFSKSVDIDSPVYVVMGEPGSPYFALATDAWASPPNERKPLSQFGGRRLFAYLYTDRQSYLPGERVHVKAVVRLLENGRYRLPDAQSATLTIKPVADGADAPPDRPVAALPVSLSSLGTASIFYDLPADLPPGGYCLGVQGSNEQSCFQVLEYRERAVEITLVAPQTELQFGENLRVNGSFQYTSGIPVALLPYRWRLYAYPLAFDLPEGFVAGIQQLDWMELLPEGAGEIIAQGVGRSDGRGNILVDVSAEELAQKLMLPMARRLVVEVLAGEGATPLCVRQTSMIVHPSAFYVALRPDHWVVESGAELSLAVQTIDWHKAVSPAHLLSATLEQVSWTSQLDGGSPNSPQALYQLISTVDFRTDEDGQARLAFRMTEAGMYRLLVSGEGAASSIFIWVNGRADVSLPYLPGKRLPLFVQKTSFRAGEEAYLFIPNAFHASLALITIERQQLQRQPRVIAVSGTGLEYPMKLSADDAPNVFVSVVLIGVSPEGRADVRYGNVILDVEPTSERLHVAAIHSPKQPFPGQDVAMALRVTDSASLPVQAELSVAVVEKHALFAGCWQAQSVQEAFYAAQPQGVVTAIPLFAESSYQPQVAPDAAADERNNVSALCPTAYGSTVYWNASLLTDVNGVATLAFSLPQQWSEWTVDIRAVDADTRVGETRIALSPLGQ